MTPSDYPQNWDWYHQKFLGSGEYLSNTWRPTSAVLRVEDTNHPATRNLPAAFKSAPNEWYRWKNNLRANPDIKVLLSIDPASFPLGTGPKPNEIWHSGDFLNYPPLVRIDPRAISAPHFLMLPMTFNGNGDGWSHSLTLILVRFDTGQG